jgi:AcrR family transcriptional regulator
VTNDKRKWARRKEARPAEIVKAAMDAFAEKGFADTKLDDVARRAGVVKGTLYRYFETKEAVFRAVVQEAVVTQLNDVERAASAFQGSLVEFVPMLLHRAAHRIGNDRLPRIARMVLAESRSFPDLAAIWHDELASRMLALVSRLIANAQARGEVRPGDPGLYAFSIIGPMATAVLFHEVFGSARSTAPDLTKLANQHAETILRGMLMSPPGQRAAAL